MKKINPTILIILTVMLVVIAFLPCIVPYNLLLGKSGDFIRSVSSGIVIIPLLFIIIILSFFAPRRWAIIVWIVIALLIATAFIPVTYGFKKCPPQSKGIDE